MSNAQDATADFVARKLEEAERPFVRLNTEELLTLSFDYEVAGQIRGAVGNREGRIQIDEISSIYYRRPIPPVVPAAVPDHVAAWMTNEARRAWGGALAARQAITWVNHPLAVSGASYKPEQLARAKRFQLAVPHSLITNDPERARNFCDTHRGNVIAKPVGHGEILADQPDDDRIVYTNRVPSGDVDDFRGVANCPTFFQEAITKSADVRVTVVGLDSFAVSLWSQENPWSAVDCRRENMRGMRYEVVHLDQPLSDLLVSFVHSYGLLFGAVDLIRDLEGKYWFLELNPAGQWAWLEQLGYGNISGSLIALLSRQ